jgi:hypothetical protein
MAQKSIQANFEKILEKAINEKFTGSLVFLGPNGGIVRVVLIDGRIKHIDSTWGYGKSELEKIKIWGQGTCLIKTLTDKDKETFSKMSDIEYETKEIKKQETQTTKKTIILETPKSTKLLPHRIIDGGINTLEEILSDIQIGELSGFLKIKPSNNILIFYKGRILSGWSNFPPSQRIKNYYLIKEIINERNQVLLYNLETETAYSIITLFINKVLISGIDTSVINLEELIEDAKINLFNGIIWLNGNIRILMDFQMGEIKHILKIDEIVRYIEFPTSLDLKFAKIYKFAKLPEGELYKMGIKVPTKEEIEKFINKWNKLNSEIVNKIGKKVAQKTFEKYVKNNEFSSLFEVREGILKPISLEKNSYLLFEGFIEISSLILDDLRTFIGGGWLEEKLKKFYIEEKEIIEILGIEEVLKLDWKI